MENPHETSALSVEQAFNYLGIGRAHLYRLMDAGAIAYLHIGRRRLLLKQHLDAFLQERLAEAEAER